MSPVDQVRRAFAPGQRLPALLGFALGGFFPFSSYWCAHHDVKVNHWLWFAVIGGFIVSSTSVFMWARLAFRSTIQAVGFVIITEVGATFFTTPWLSLMAMTILVFINGISKAVSLQVRSVQAPK